MPRQSKCSYCQKEGHNITQCDSERGNELYHHIRAKGFEFICLEWRTIHQRASMFYCYLMRICRLDEIKLILSKRQCRTSGRKRELAARIVNSYFIQELAYGPYSRYCIKHKERVHIDVYANYWRLLAEGELLNEAKQYLDRFLDLIKQQKERQAAMEKFRQQNPNAQFGGPSNFRGRGQQNARPSQNQQRPD
jgi:hypothetical protein